MSGYISTHTGKQDTVVISAKRFEQSPYLTCYDSPQMVRGSLVEGESMRLGILPEDGA